MWPTSVILGISIGLTAVVLVVERKEGLIDRTWVAGVNVSEMIISQVLTQFFILLVQIILVVVVIVYAFKVGTCCMVVVYAFRVGTYCMVVASVSSHAGLLANNGSQGLRSLVV